MSFLQSAPTAFHTSKGCSHDHGGVLVAFPGKSGASRQPSFTGKAGLVPLLRLFQDPSRSIGSVVREFWDGGAPESSAGSISVEARRRLLYHQMHSALNLDDWQAAAEELDHIEDNEAWKAELASDEYHPEIVAGRLRQLEEARSSGNVGRMLFLIRTSLTRGLGEMGNLKLYKHSHVGTKHLIENYINAALETLEAILDLSAPGAPGHADTRYILEQVILARQSFGRSALLLSGGATFGMNHIGVLKALWETRLLPRIISGASAGSIIGATLCVSTDEEIPKLLEEFPYGDLAVFEREGDEDGVLRKVTRLLKTGAWIDTSHLIRVMKKLLGDLTFQEAYNRTRRILNICVSSASIYELPRLLNYVTAPNVLIWSAVAASCSVPFVFSSTSLLAKDLKTGEAVPWDPSPQRWIDGSVDNDLPMTRLAEMFNVNHFIVSQVNPHVVPFLAKEEQLVAAQAQSNSPGAGPGWLHSVSRLAKAEALHRIQMLTELGVFPNTLTKARSVLSQKYSGDITILPEISYADFPRMLKNPNSGFMLAATLCGERATWPKLSRVRNHCAIELALDNAVQQLRTRAVFSRSQVDLRLNTVQAISRGAFPNKATLSSSRNTLPTTAVITSQSFGPEKENPVFNWTGSNRSKKSRVRSKTTDARSQPWDPSGTSISLKRGSERRPVHSAQRSTSARPRKSLSLNLSLLPSFSLTSRSPRPTQTAANHDDEEDEDGGTSNISQDFTSLSDSSSSPSTSTPTSPSYFRDPTTTASSRLFPFASQPNTPSFAPPAISSSPAGAGMGMGPLTKTKTLDPTLQCNTPMSSGSTHKRLFHDQSAKQHAPADGEHSNSQAQNDQEDLDTVPIARTVEDLSGTKGMAIRKKESEKDPTA